MAAHPRYLLQQSFFSLMLAASPSVSFCAISTDSSTGELRVVGVIHYDSADPGCWQLQTAEGDVYELRAAELPDTLRQEGTRVTLLGTTVDQPGACQSGNVFVINRVVSSSSD
ncbi:MAG TPA: hypothetical protein VJQ44_13715 [Gemmatimonadales bacterium]|nr:hypothetical protein [Gemmatimonadales bacterium]